MLQGVNIEEIKKYNASLKQCRDRAASLNAEIEYTNKEIDTLCAELSQELGTTVTRENIEQIYNEQLEKINNTLQSGNAVLNKIANEENSTTQNAFADTTPVSSPVAHTSAPEPVLTAPVAPAAPVNPVAQPTGQTAPTQQSTPVAPPLFSQPQVGGQELPNFFGAKQI